MRNRRRVIGFTKWLLERKKDSTDLNELVEFVASDNNWLGRSKYFNDFMYCLQRAKREDLLYSLAYTWKEYCGQEVPLLQQDYFAERTQKAYDKELPQITQETKTYPVAPLECSYIYVTFAHSHNVYRVRYIGKSIDPVSRYHSHLREYGIGIDWDLSTEKEVFYYPIMLILETALAKDADKRERAFVWYFTNILNEKLTNVKGTDYIA